VSDSPLRVVEVAVEPPYAVRIGPGALARLEPDVERLGLRPVALLSDARVFELHGARLGALASLPVHLAPRGEEGKSFAALEALLEHLASVGADRGACLVTLGGGSLSDLGGLAASLYARGIDVVHAPTTLLAQVDASVGGKTAINLRAAKNLAGTVHQPRTVLADTDTLATLSADELRSGLGEVVKTALVGGESELSLIEERAPALVDGDASALARATAACVRVKARIVAADPLERGRRRELNLGHTFAHAIERAAGYGVIPHGHAVATGVSLALACARELGKLEEPELPERIDALLRALGLSPTWTELAERWDARLEPDRVLDAVALDKKGRASEPSLVLPRGAGRIELDVRPGRDFVAAFLRRQAGATA
jgi:3-dehydroquinate synthetase